MRDYAKISTRIWTSRKFQAVDDAARLLYLYLHTCQHANSVGCFVLKDLYACADLEWDKKAYRKAIESLSIAGLVGIDRVEPVVRLVGFFKFSPFTNPKHAQGAINIALSLPDCPQKAEALREIAQEKHVFDPSDLEYPKPIETLPIHRDRDRDLLPRPRTETETEHETEPEPDAEKLASNGFLEFWGAYPRQVARAKAQASYKAKLKSGADPLDILKGLERYLSMWKRERTALRYVPHPTVWLNQERWADNIPEARKTMSEQALDALGPVDY